MFHSFGFTVGTILPILSGMKNFFLSDPLHFAVIPEIAYEIHATIMFGTNTFLRLTLKKRTPMTSILMRYVVPERKNYRKTPVRSGRIKFGIRILEAMGLPKLHR